MLAIDATTGIIYRPETFDTWILNESKSYFPLRLNTTDVILDLGAHIGTFSARAKIEQPKCDILSVEASSSNHGVLQKNAEKFNFDALHGAVVHSSLDGTDVTMYINAKKNNALHSSVRVRGRGTESTLGYGLSKLLATKSFTFLKIDIEGAEYELDLIEQLSAPSGISIKRIVMEAHLLGKANNGRSRRILTEEMVPAFEKIGFKCTRQPIITDKNWTTMLAFERP